MIFTIFYMYATMMQWWRLAKLKNKLTGTLNSKNALLLCDEAIIYDSKKTRSFENLLFKIEDRIGCTVVPKQKVNLSHWISFPKDSKYFPIYFRYRTINIESPNIYILIEAMLENYVKHSANILEVESYGELIAWKTSDTFEAILKTDLNKLTRLVQLFSQSTTDINHELKVLKIETIDVDGFPTKIKYDKKFSKESLLKYSYSPIHWKEFADTIKQIYSKIRDTKNPKITIENGKSDEVKKVPVSEVKPIKKDGKRSEDKNTLEVATGDYRRHKSSEHRRISDKHKTDVSKIDGTSRTKEDIKYKKIDKEAKREHVKENEHKSPKQKPETPKTKKEEVREKHKKDVNKLDSKKSKSTSKKLTEVDDKGPKMSQSRRTTSSEKKLIKTAAICDENEDVHSAEPCDVLDLSSLKSSEIKPPNILIYADSIVAKENVKSVFINMLNKDKYTIYDLPTDSKQMMWNDCTVLVVVCGNVPQHLTLQLLQYLLTGGQLLCLCSDFLYSVLHTFTTAEVREHELVRFSYGKWKQVKMMHHIFCYQASPTKKQFSKDSDNSNQSSNGSSPVAPRTPSTVEIQHNSKDYVIQVQVLGTEETWQTPSLLLASVKGGSGKAIFSQVHLEINPDQFEEDESKFEALKDSDEARMEILKDILINHLDIDCTNNMKVEYTPGYFLGRYDEKQNLFSECGAVVDKKLECKKITAEFCVKQHPEPPTAKFMPIYINMCPSNFFTLTYFENLETEHIGRLVVYSDVMTSSQYFLEKILTHGFVVIPGQQTSGIGRSDNLWISPIGSALFSLQLHVPMDSPLGQALPLIQHITMVAVVEAIKGYLGCTHLDIGIKWPNDLYANKTIKIGGLLVSSTITDKLAIVNIGCGVNLNNSNPTTCINSLIEDTNKAKGTNMKKIVYEEYFAWVFNEFEKIYKRIQNGDMDHFYNLYYKYWLHENSEIAVCTTKNDSVKMKIVGIDNFGFLKVQSADEDISTIHPDGNTFDMLKGLISRKTF